MFSVAAKRNYSPDVNSVFFAGLAQTEDNFQKWIEHPTSEIVHHESACCEEARLWFLSFARSMDSKKSNPDGLNAPGWLLENYTWGPSVWPITWCEVVKEKIIDCGVFAALAREIFAAQGQPAHAAQGLFRYNETCTGHWKDLWEAGKKDADTRFALVSEEEAKTFPWVGTNVVYHEFCVLETKDGQARVYDSTFNLWHEPRQRLGFGSLLALRTESPRLLTWGDKTLCCGEWTIL